MLPIRSWRIYYADGSTFSSDDGTWAEAPPFGVQCIVYYHVPEGVTFQEVGDDVSIYEFVGLPEGTDEHAKMGLWTDGESYWRVHDAVRRSVTP
jgi:hypothetical protein